MGAAHSAGPDVLVVEDEALIRMLICEGLRAAGLAVAEASDAEEALTLLGVTPSGRLAALVTDLNLGPGPDGLALAAEARRRCPSLPVVYATANPDRARERGLGPLDRVVEKPFYVGEVLTALSEIGAVAASPS